MSLFGRALLCFFVAVPVLAQSQAFEKITIKAARSADPRSMRMQVLPDGELVAHAVLVINLISYAYDVPSNPSPRLNPPPAWIYDDRYDIAAKASLNAITTTSQDAEIQLRVKQMIRRLLADHFGLVMKVHRQRMSAYAMTVSSSGSRLQHSVNTGQDCIFDTAPDGCHTFVIGFGHPLNANAISMNDLARYIENWTDLPPVNRTHFLAVCLPCTRRAGVLCDCLLRLQTVMGALTSPGFPPSSRFWASSVSNCIGMRKSCRYTRSNASSVQTSTGHRSPTAVDCTLLSMQWLADQP
jgi:uncharacterized protein (TIGR03435 family)